MGDEWYWLCHTCRQYKDLGYQGYHRVGYRQALADVQQLQQDHAPHQVEIYSDPQGFIAKQYVEGFQPQGPWMMGEPAAWIAGLPYQDIDSDKKIRWRPGDPCPGCSETGEMVPLQKRMPHTTSHEWDCPRCGLSWVPGGDREMPP